MQLAYGTYFWPVGSVFISKEVSVEFGATGRPVARTHQISCRGTLAAADQATMTAEILTMEAALSLPNQSLILYNDDLSVSSVVLYASRSLGGVRVTKLAYPTTEGAENATFRTWEATFESKYAVTTLPENFATKFTETLSISGGAPQYILKPNKLGLFQRQLNYPLMPWVASQTGTATGFRGYPVVPPPIWPAAQREGVKISRTAPRQEGYFLTDYGVSWEYVYESPTPLAGLPTFWVNPF